MGMAARGARSQGWAHCVLPRTFRRCSSSSVGVVHRVVSRGPKVNPQAEVHLTLCQVPMHQDLLSSVHEWLRPAKTRVNHRQTTLHTGAQRQEEFRQGSLPCSDHTFRRHCVSCRGKLEPARALPESILHPASDQR